MEKQVAGIQADLEAAGYDEECELEWGLTGRTEDAFRRISRALLAGRVGRKWNKHRLGTTAPQPTTTAARGLLGAAKTPILLTKKPDARQHRCLLPVKVWDAHFELLENVCGELDEAAVLVERAVLRLTALGAIEYITAADFLDSEIQAGTVAESEVDVSWLDAVAGRLGRGIECCRLNLDEAGKATYAYVAQYQRWTLAVALALIQHGQSDATFPR